LLLPNTRFVTEKNLCLFSVSPVSSSHQSTEQNEKKIPFRLVKICIFISSRFSSTFHT
jgi:hypothetical protein